MTQPPNNESIYVRVSIWLTELFYRASFLLLAVAVFFTAMTLARQAIRDNALQQLTYPE